MAESQQDSAMLAALKTDLSITAAQTAYNARLEQLLTVAQAEIIKAGASTLDTSVPSDQELIVMYAAWLWRRRDTMEGMPRMLQYHLHNRALFDPHEVTEDA